MKRLFSFLFFVSFFFLFRMPIAFAYIDPGTVSSGSGILASIFPFAILIFGFLFRPVKRGFSFLKKKFFKNRKESFQEHEPKT